MTPFVIVRLVLLGSLSWLLEASKEPPPRVAKSAKRGWGGGSDDTIGHGKPMQQVGQSRPVQELAEVPNWEDFYTRFFRMNEPVVFRGAARGILAYSKWTDDYIRETWGKREVTVEINKTETRGGPSTEMLLDKFMDEMYKDSRADELYAVVSFDGDKKAMADLSLPAPIDCKETRPQSATLWMSSGGTSSVLHQDDAENVLMMFSGRKQVMLVHQDEAQKIYAPIAEVQGTSPVHQNWVDLVAFPQFANVSWISGEISAGDILYIPHTYWHQVVSFERNLALNLWWQNKEDWRWWDPENSNEYDPLKFGRDDFIPFNDLKERSVPTTVCTKLPPDHDLNKVKFMDEDKFKHYVAKMRRKALKKGEL